MNITLLSQLKPGESATVSKIIGDGTIVQRLLEMGFYEGADIAIVRTALLGDPIEVRISGYNLSLRKSEASLIEVKR